MYSPARSAGGNGNCFLAASSCGGAVGTVAQPDKYIAAIKGRIAAILVFIFVSLACLWFVFLSMWRKRRAVRRDATRLEEWDSKLSVRICLVGRTDYRGRGHKKTGLKVNADVVTHVDHAA